VKQNTAFSNKTKLIKHLFLGGSNLHK